MDFKSDKSFFTRVVIIVFIVFLALSFFQFFKDTFEILLLALAAIIWAILFRSLADILVSKTKLNRRWSTISSVIIIMGGFVGLNMIIMPGLSEQIPELKQQIPKAITLVKEKLSEYTIGQSVLEEISDSEKFLDSNQGAIGSFIKGTITSTFNFLTNILVIVVVGFFFLSDPKVYKSMITKAFPIRYRDRTAEVLTAQYVTLKSWLAGKLLSMCILSLLTMIGLWILGIPLGLTLGLIAGLLSFIPNLGPILGLIPAALIAFTVSPSCALYVAILYAVIQLLESNLLVPLIQQNQVSIPPGVILLSQVLMGIALGIMGIILTVPILVLLKVAIQMVYLEDVLDDDVDLDTA